MLFLGFVVTWMLTLVLVGMLLLPLLVVLAITMPIVAAVAANQGERFSYPLTPQMVS
jgi:uncharacterized Tic20 family protein